MAKENASQAASGDGEARASAVLVTTFKLTMLGVLLFCGAVVIFVLPIFGAD